MKIMRKLLLAAILFYIPLHSMAWGVLGHRIVAEIADSYLTNKARRQIQRILGSESMAMCSNWADFIKSDSNYNYLSNWHYINLREGLAEADIEAHLKQDTSVNAYTKMNWLVQELGNKALPADQQLLYLRLLIHIVGDLHQPMHVGRLEDLGGNRIRLSWFNSSTNLHAVWDEKLVEFQQLSYTEYVSAINHTTKAQRKAWQAEPPSSWVINSYNIAQKLYAGVTPDQKLSYRYNFDHVQILNDQLLKGGVHLAGLLNNIFG
ncbi:MAG: S1/P1 nuclease [Pseudobacter sp.]|uniref:S1/P1 nuclease n=1 Tax=Pseudobacter sp. TaxID=2045420 RepID=UPI003F7EA081